MTYTLKITPTGLALLEGYCRAAGRSLKDALGLHLLEQSAAAGSHPAATATAAPAAVATAAPQLPSPAPLIQPPPPFAPPVPATPAEEDALLATLGN